MCVAVAGDDGQDVAPRVGRLGQHVAVRRRSDHRPTGQAPPGRQRDDARHLVRVGAVRSERDALYGADRITRRGHAEPEHRGVAVMPVAGIVHAHPGAGRLDVDHPVGGQPEPLRGPDDRAPVGVADVGHRAVAGPPFDVLAERHQPRRHPEGVAGVGGVGHPGDQLAGRERSAEVGDHRDVAALSRRRTGGQWPRRRPSRRTSCSARAPARPPRGPGPGRRRARSARPAPGRTPGSGVAPGAAGRPGRGRRPAASRSRRCGGGHRGRGRRSPPTAAPGRRAASPRAVRRQPGSGSAGRRRAACPRRDGPGCGARSRIALRDVEPVGGDPHLPRHTVGIADLSRPLLDQALPLARATSPRSARRCGPDSARASRATSGSAVPAGRTFADAGATPKAASMARAASRSASPSRSARPAAAP